MFAATGGMTMRQPCRTVPCLLAMWLSCWAASATGQTDPARQPTGVVQMGFLMRLDHVPTLSDDGWGDRKDGPVMFHGAVGILAPVGKRDWVGPVAFGSVGEVGGFAGLEARWRRPVRVDAAPGGPTYDLSLGVLLSGEIEDFPTRLPGLTAAAGYNINRAVALTARVDVYRYREIDTSVDMWSVGDWRTGSDFFLGVQAGSWGALLVATIMAAAVGSSLGSLSR
jgi:hypothetical protein